MKINSADNETIEQWLIKRTVSFKSLCYIIKNIINEAAVKNFVARKLFVRNITFNHDGY